MKIGILGYGTVGQGVVQILDQMSKVEVKVVKIFDLPYKRELIGSRFTDDLDKILNDKSIELVVEVMGGGTFAYECIKKSLNACKSVVTANKEVISNHLDELNSLAIMKKVGLRFEASVGGGIPILNNIAANSQFDQIKEVYGIINGTTNYILSQMSKGKSFASALETAKKHGFAEADPTADLEGLDMVRKIAILSDLAFQTQVDINQIWNYPITKVDYEIITFLKKQQYVLKYVASSVRELNSLTILVEPTIIPEQHQLANINDENNTIIYKGLYNEQVQVSGKGAGSLPTASAIVSDILAIKYQPQLPYANRTNYYVNQNLEKVARYLIVSEDEKPTFIKTSLNAIKEMKKLRFYARVWEEDHE